MCSLWIVALIFFVVFAVAISQRKTENMTPDGLEYLVPEQENQDFELIGVAPEQPAFELGFGMGPGLYGSGRHTSEMIGN